MKELTDLIEMNNVVFTPESTKIEEQTTAKKIFLAGTIDNGDSVDWQNMLINKLPKNGYVIYNPRREHWNPDADEKELEYQIHWELEHLEKADMIIMNILPDSKSPISLLELGLFLNTGKIVLFCDKGYYRWKNIEAVANRYSALIHRNGDKDYIDKMVKLITTKS